MSDDHREVTAQISPHGGKVVVTPHEEFAVIARRTLYVCVFVALMMIVAVVTSVFFWVGEQQDAIRGLRGNRVVALATACILLVEPGDRAPAIVDECFDEARTEVARQERVDVEDIPDPRSPTSGAEAAERASPTASGGDSDAHPFDVVVDVHPGSSSTTRVEGSQPRGGDASSSGSGSEAPRATARPQSTPRPTPAPTPLACVLGTCVKP